MNDDLTKKLNDNIQYMKKNYCTNYAGCQNRGLNIFCLNKGIVTAVQCTMCHDRKMTKWKKAQSRIGYFGLYNPDDAIISETSMHHLACAMCDNDKCVRGTKECEFEQWKEKEEEK